MIDVLREIETRDLLREVSYAANNIEEICCGIHNYAAYYQDYKARKDLIIRIQDALEELQEAVKKLDHEHNT